MYIEFNSLGLKFCAEVKASRFIPASVCGLPENSYPAEGGEIEEWEVLDVLIDGAEPIDALFLLNSTSADQIEQAAYEAIAAYQPDYDDFDYDF